MTTTFSPRSKRVIQSSLDEVTRRYGGDGQPGEIATYPYHNLDHARYVMDGAVQLATYLGLSHTAIEIAAMSGAAHDVIRESTPEATPEEASASWLTDVMRHEGYDQSDIDTMVGAIIATTASLNEHGVLTSQTESIKPDTEIGKVALCVASADLRSLYAPEGPLLAHRYFRELQGLSGNDTPSSLEGLRGYQVGEVSLVNDYRYPFAPAEELFAKDRADIIAHHAAVLAALDEGHITTWSDVIDLDTAYFTEHSTRRGV